MRDYRLRPATVAESLYAYDQDSQINGVTGRIGHLRMDFGDGSEWYSEERPAEEPVAGI